MAIDPVCGKQIIERQAAAAYFFEGRMYYFCSARDRDQFASDPSTYADRVPAMRLKVGVMGAASGYLPPDVRQAAYAMGQAIAAKGMVLVTGAAPGLPWESARGARDEGGLSIGISPALSLDEHENVYKSPADYFDVLIFTGSGLMGREIVNIRSSDIVVIVGGHSGTLGEFAIAYDEGKLIGVLEGTSGIADVVPRLVRAIDKETGAHIIYSREPMVLLDRLVEAYVGEHFTRPSVFVEQRRRLQAETPAQAEALTDDEARRRSLGNVGG